MQNLQTTLVALHLRHLLSIAVALKLGYRSVQGFLVGITASPGEGGGLHQRPPFIRVEEQRGCAEMLRQTIAAAGPGVRNDRNTAGAERVNIAVDRADAEFKFFRQLGGGSSALLQHPQNR
ncbi:hypothetical protein D3C81_1832850 [compost metagenome]